MGGILMAESDTIFGVGSLGELLWNLPALGEGTTTLWSASVLRGVLVLMKGGTQSLFLFQGQRV